MKNVKFRVFWKEQNRYIIPDNEDDDSSYFYELKSDFEGNLMVCEFFGGDFNRELKDVSIEQWTGLVDKNGIEVYEEDLIRFDNDSANFRVTSWDSTSIMTRKDIKFNLAPETESGDKFSPEFLNLDNCKFEVVGNTNYGNLR